MTPYLDCQRPWLLYIKDFNVSLLAKSFKWSYFFFCFHLFLKYILTFTILPMSMRLAWRTWLLKSSNAFKDQSVCVPQSHLNSLSTGQRLPLLSSAKPAWAPHLLRSVGLEGHGYGERLAKVVTNSAWRVTERGNSTSHLRGIKPGYFSRENQELCVCKMTVPPTFLCVCVCVRDWVEGELHSRGYPKGPQTLKLTHTLMDNPMINKINKKKTKHFLRLPFKRLAL